MTAAQIGQLITGSTGFLLLCLSGYGLASLRYKVPGTALFVAQCLAGAVWCLGYLVELSQTLAGGFFLAAQIEYLGLAFLPSLWLLVTLSWIEHPLGRSRPFRFLVLGSSLLIASLVWTNEAHHGWYASIVPTGQPGFARYSPGVLYYPGCLLLASTFVISSVLALAHRLRASLHKKKTAVILTVNVFPLAFGAAYQLGLRPWGLDLTILALIPAFAAVAFGLFRHDFIRLVPIARDTVFESLDHPVFVFDNAARLVDHNTAAQPFIDQVGVILRAGDEPRGETTLDLPNGTRTFRYRRSPIQGPLGMVQGTVLVLNDVTEERRLLDELAHQATHDSLTGIANRRHFEAHALGEITRADRHHGALALIVFDLDWFKAVNDGYGHPAGDKVLKTAAAVVGSQLRPYDLFARVGGEEFAILMPETTASEAWEAADRARRTLEETPQVVPGAVLKVTGSFGVVTLDQVTETLSEDPRGRLDALLGLADRALYRAKEQGRNRVCR